jgi:quercetin dioxygenase-like cupin family protein
MNYIHIGEIDITQIKNKLIELGEEIWLEHTLRQNIFDAHKDTQTVELMWDMDSLKKSGKGKIHTNFYKFNIDSLLVDLKPIYEKKYGKGEFVRVLLVKLKKESKITPHVDMGNSLVSCKRTHIAVITNPDVIFVVGGESKNMKEGDIWEINNQNVHSVTNNSNEDRIHFIIDYETSTDGKPKKSLI